METSLKAFWASLIVYYLSLGLTKAAILLQYQRIFTARKFTIASWSIMAVVVVYTIWTVFGSIFACVPARAFWTREPAKCIDQFAMWFTNAAINILTDFAIILLPMPVIRSLNLARRQKQALLGIFAIGGL
jgi:ABC-type Na+ efflux pump permease subunit